ncbi:hypothetical protein HELRODRAFT_132900, partial [Helobdella robusta]|uniref:Protein kinase domain-containing protein n=1 Tax=Helobdella robusta TaxID=6412 RepID=T1EHZ9_HELRO
KWEFPRERLTMLKQIGESNYCKTWLAAITGKEKKHLKYVAVKVLKDNGTDDDAQRFLDDLKVMMKFKFHENIIQLIGCCTTSYPTSSIVEYVDGGPRTLLHVLQKQSQNPANMWLTTKVILSFLLQIASAMQYACSLQCIHRCLCCQKIFVTSDLICKLGDFDLCEHFQSRNSEKSVNTPIRWLPPESLFVLERSMKSNVWSYGVLMWECFTLGGRPYSDLNDREVVEFVQRGGRLNKPSLCSSDIFETMQDCWVYYPTKRPNFEMLKSKMNKF